MCPDSSVTVTADRHACIYHRENWSRKWTEMEGETNVDDGGTWDYRPFLESETAGSSGLSSSYPGDPLPPALGWAGVSLDDPWSISIVPRAGGGSVVCPLGPAPCVEAAGAVNMPTPMPNLRPPELLPLLLGEPR